MGHARLATALSRQDGRALQMEDGRDAAATLRATFGSRRRPGLRDALDVDAEKAVTLRLADERLCQRVAQPRRWRGASRTRVGLTEVGGDVQ